MTMYKCWSPDNCIEEEEGEIMSAGYCGSAIDVADAYAEERFYDWEQPESFEIVLFECNEKGESCGPIRKFSFEVEYEPSFHSFEVK